MRIAITNWSNRLAGGAEQYISDIGQILLARGHELSLCHEASDPEERDLIPLPTSAVTWNIHELGLENALFGLRQWRPDVIYCQGMLDPWTEARIQEIAPTVLFAHNYNGTCISGSRTTHFPIVQPCTRRFGPACLGRFYPLRCGGLNPVTMIRDYQRSAQRLSVLSSYGQVITHSAYVAREFRRNEIRCETVRFFTSGPARDLPAQRPDWAPGKQWRLLMITRMTEAKGGSLLLRALPSIAARLSKPVKLVMAGDGPSRARWEVKAARLCRIYPEIEVLFPGWLSGHRREEVLSETDLLLMPSLWPEPFGMAGPEAGHWGVPAVAFSVGGIPGWLKDGVNGCLAATPATTSSYCEAVAHCLSDTARYIRLRAAALAAAQAMTIEDHYEDLIRVFQRVLKKPTASFDSAPLEILNHVTGLL